MTLTGAFPPSRCKRHLEIVLGKMLQPESSTDLDVVLPYIRAANVGEGRIDTAELKEMWFTPKDVLKFNLKKGDLIVLEGGDVGRSAILDETPDCVGFQNSVHRVRPLTGNDARFSHYWITHLKESGYIELICSKATLAHFTVEKFSESPYPAIDTEIQCQIANFLDRETARIDQLIEKKQRLVELLDEKRSSLVAAAVTGKLDLEAQSTPSNRTNCEESELSALLERNVELTGRVVDSFPQTNEISVQLIRLGLLSQIFSGGTPDKRNQEFWENGDLPWIGSGEVNQRLITKPTTFVTRRAVQESSTKLFPLGSVAMALAGQGKTKATVAMMGLDAYGNQSLACVTKFKGNSRFLFYWLDSLYKEVRGLSSQDTRDGLNQSMLGQIPVPVYPNETQELIVNFLDRKVELIERIRKRVSMSIEKCRELRSSLITHAVTGQIDVSEWSKHDQTERQIEHIEESSEV